jgi:hypothetical protein
MCGYVVKYVQLSEAQKISFSNESPTSMPWRKNIHTEY